ncbi:ATPase, P-type (transporting), HAD superfamily, subfamily IC [Sporomusa malonica]|uniref:P-type Cu(+) transporter n=1 Tax=Sporomusa malonica TaxID=112901 RepID=A0A1W2DQF6_9FIRM|nr:ATPase, P-type (transporting), HAD superfamily, subfamily IC [Sporomusa malonica]
MVASTITAKACLQFPGRLRISVEGLLRNRSYAQYLSMRLSERNGIRSATANHLTGKLLVFFKPNRIMVSEILQEICLCRTQYSKLLDRTAESPNTLASSKTETNKKVTSTTELALWSIGIAALTFLLTRDVRRSMAVLIAGCPVAVALSRHAALGLAVVVARRGGVFVKDANMIEIIGKADTVVFDESSIIAGATAELHDIVGIDKNHTAAEVLRLAASTVAGTTHPLTGMLLGHVKSDGRELSSASDVEVRAFGVMAVVDSDRIIVGNVKFLAQENIMVERAFPRIRRMEHLGLSLLCIAINGKLAGIVGYSYQLRPESHEAVGRLRALGVNYIGLVIGETSNSIQDIIDRLGVPEYWTADSSESKKAIIDQLQQNGRRVIMVGNGGNDAQALKAATVGMAIDCNIAEGTAQSADVIIKGDDIREIPNLIHLGKFTDEVIWQNRALSAGLSAVGVSLAAVQSISPMAIMWILGIITVLANSARILTCVNRSNDTSVKGW